MTVATISPQELKSRMQSGGRIDMIDVRTPVEYRELHVSGARLVPLDQLQPAQFATEGNGLDEPLYVLCRSGGRARQATEQLHAAGCTQAVVVEGGTLACEQAGLPVVRGKKAMSLERQVRIAAGALVLTGAVLGYFVHPYWIGLSAFVGAGLIFAGITDTCGMGMLIARMPWNQVADASGSTCAVANGPPSPGPDKPRQGNCYSI